MTTGTLLYMLACHIHQPPLITPTINSPGNMAERLNRRRSIALFEDP
jgi:hypothetical protein